MNAIQPIRGQESLYKLNDLVYQQMHLRFSDMDAYNIMNIVIL